MTNGGTLDPIFTAKDLRSFADVLDDLQKVLFDAEGQRQISPEAFGYMSLELLGEDGLSVGMVIVEDGYLRVRWKTALARLQEHEERVAKGEAG